MKYILLMSGSKARVDTYRAWSKKDIDGPMAVLANLNRELTQSGEFVATQPLTAPHEAKVVRGLKEGMPITDGIFPESKEFLLGYWIVDVATCIIRMYFTTLLPCGSQLSVMTTIAESASRTAALRSACWSVLRRGPARLKFVRRKGRLG